MADRHRNDPTNRPFHPSRALKLQEEFEVVAADLTGGVPPTALGNGFDVDKWSSVMVAVHPSNPNFAEAVQSGWTITLRPWKYREGASGGSRAPSGQWFALEPWVVSLDGSGAMERTFFVPDAKKLYLEPVEWDGPPAGTPQVSIGAYGIGRYGDPGAPMLGIIDSGSSSVPSPLPVIVTNPVWEHTAEDSESPADTTPGLSPTVWYTIDMDTYRKLGVQFDIDPGTNGGGAGTVFIEMQGRISSTGAWAPILIDTFDTPAEQIAVTGPGGTVITEILADNAEKLAVYDEVRVGLYAAVGNVGQRADIFWQELY